MGENAQSVMKAAFRGFIGGMELADLAAESVIVYDPDGVIQYWNPASERLYGWRASLTVGHHFSDFSAPGNLYAKHWADLLKKGGWEGTVLRQSALGRVQYAYVRQTVRRDCNGAVIDVVEYGRSIAPRTTRNAEGPDYGDAKTESTGAEDKYHKLLRHMPTALWQVDARPAEHIFDRLRANGVSDIRSFLDDHPELVDLAIDTVVVTVANRSAVALVRASEAAELVRPARYLFAATPGLAKRVMIAHFEGQRNYMEEARIFTFDGCVRDVMFSATFPAAPEQLDTSFVTMQDITDRLRTEAQLRKLQSEHERAARISTLGELAASIAHEVKQPLSAIVTNGNTSLRWLSKPEINVEKVRSLTERIISSALRADEIIQRIQRMAVKKDAARAVLNIAEVMEEGLSFVRHDVEAKAIDLLIDIEPNLPDILGDRVQLQQVVVNLLVNSVQAISQAESQTRRIHLRVSSTAARGRVVISVRDSGPGISQENLAHVFESFFTTKTGGMGIGLAICHSIVSEHGGQIDVSNHPDGGARFQVTLPVAPGFNLPRDGI